MEYKNLDTILNSLKSKEDLDIRFKKCNTIKLPDIENIKSILKNIKKIIFQGYHSFENKDELKIILKNLAFELKEEILKSIVFYHFMDGNICKKEEYENVASNLTESFLTNLPQIQSKLLKDVEATYINDPAAKNYDEIILFYSGIDALFAYRVANYLYQLKIPYLPEMISNIAKTQTSIDIHPAAKIGEGIMIDHGVGVVIGETTIIGNNVKIYQGVTLGAISTRKENIESTKQRHPTIKDNVTLYSNATILGGDTVIEENCTIGGNVFLTSSVEKDTTVILEKQNYIYKKKTK